VHGTLELDGDVIEVPLGRHPYMREKYAVRPETGKPSLTKYELQKQYHGYALMKMMPRTGRTHQIRVHLKRLGRHILGDNLYGFKSKKDTIARVNLHAYLLYLNHPIKGEKMEFVAPLFNDMKILFSQNFDEEEINSKIDPDRISHYFHALK
jgi:23S rRNA pseudouridine1911/1915/1917 synthase